MDLDLTTPAILFPTISLLMVAYTNRFLTIATRVRSLSENFKKSPDKIILGQIKSLRKRLKLIKNTQALGIASLFLCVMCMFILFAGKPMAAKVTFGASLILLMFSLALSFREIMLSVEALNLALSDIEKGL